MPLLLMLAEPSVEVAERDTVNGNRFAGVAPAIVHSAQLAGGNKCDLLVGEAGRGGGGEQASNLARFITCFLKELTAGGLFKRLLPRGLQVSHNARWKLHDRRGHRWPKLFDQQ